MKYPLNINVVWHPDSEIGQEIAEYIYSTFCRDYKRPLSRGIGIPVYFRYFKDKDGKPLEIDCSKSEKTAIILLIDEEYFMDDNLRRYTSDLLKLVNNDVRIFPISLFDKAYSINPELGKLQFINAQRFLNQKLDFTNDFDFTKALTKIKSELLHDCARLLMDFHPAYKDKEKHRINSPVKLFLSHAKNDGEKITISFKQFIENSLKLDVFFDTVDVADGYGFAEQFETEIKHSALVVFHTDEYSDREWCRREVIIAKRHKSPIVVAHKIKDGEKRAFPYLGNMPTSVIHNNSKEEEELSFIRIVILTLTQVLNNLYQLRLLNNYIELYNDNNIEVKAISSPPELFNFLDIRKHTEKPNAKPLIILYPDPPLGIEEVNILNELDPEVKFLTPVNLS
ncbi:hypothetical protein GCM10022217_22650 [Chryseobacterium ginsenosidimutans]|uniref:TIR domain-containing protein n=1 Tax=Chryseobacterium ginsenosidimutans TaxID=687846 RepID=UPI0031D7C4F5